MAGPPTGRRSEPAPAGAGAGAVGVRARAGIRRKVVPVARPAGGVPGPPVSGRPVRAVNSVVESNEAVSAARGPVAPVASAAAPVV